jgi:hypothetical protein
MQRDKPFAKIANQANDGSIFYTNTNIINKPLRQLLVTSGELALLTGVAKMTLEIGRSPPEEEIALWANMAG